MKYIRYFLHWHRTKAVGQQTRVRENLRITSSVCFELQGEPDVRKDESIQNIFPQFLEMLWYLLCCSSHLGRCWYFKMQSRQLGTSGSLFSLSDLHFAQITNIFPLGLFRFYIQTARKDHRPLQNTERNRKSPSDGGFPAYRHLKGRFCTAFLLNWGT